MLIPLEKITSCCLKLRLGRTQTGDLTFQNLSSIQSGGALTNDFTEVKLSHFTFSETSEESNPCDIKFSTARLFADHMTKVHDLNPWLCKVCLKRFKEKQNYEYHSMQVTDWWTYM